MFIFCLFDCTVSLVSSIVLFTSTMRSVIIFLVAGLLVSLFRSPVLAYRVYGATVYSRDLLVSRRLCVLAKESPEIPKELRRRYRGCWAGAKLWLNARRYKLYLPAITMGNLRSLASQMDELAALARCQSEYHENSVFVGLGVAESGKRKGGGLAILVNNKWCNPGHIMVKDRVHLRH